MKTRGSNRVSSREITDSALYLRRREFLRDAALTTAAAALAPGIAFGADPPPGERLPDVKPGPFGTDEELTRLEDATTYNNFYEFGTDKSDPRRKAHTLRTKPWSVAIEGEVGRAGSIGLEDLLKPHPLEERTYRLRCVEAWSMVIPWIGFPLGDLLKRFEPTSQAKYVAFSTLHDPEQMPGQRRSVLEWPYVGGCASTRRCKPPTSWNVSAPREYGFYSNVNPEVDHPRWTQKRERRIGEFRKRPTLPFNGYADEVASLYRGMDLRANF
jgi:sulfoxide reductase catalytic subunit YedY